MDQNSLVPQHIKPQTMLQFHSARRGANNGLFMKVHVRDHREFILFSHFFIFFNEKIWVWGHVLRRILSL